MEQIRTVRDFGALIRERRRELGYTQEYVALWLGWSPRLVGEVERGRGTVGFDKVVWYATNMGIDLFAKVRGRN